MRMPAEELDTAFLGMAVPGGGKVKSIIKGTMAGRKVGHTFSQHGAPRTDQLLAEAAGSGRPVVQWLDDAAAEELIAARLPQLKSGARTFDLPEGLGRIIHPDGAFATATKARLVPSGGGVKTAYPVID